MSQNSGLSGACSCNNQEWSGRRRRGKELEGIQAEKSLSERLLVYDVGASAY
ncbi:MAG: hypothetical protein ACTHNP_01950 [Solirubrobacterales bacterium]